MKRHKGFLFAVIILAAVSALGWFVLREKSSGGLGPPRKALAKSGLPRAADVTPVGLEAGGEIHLDASAKPSGKLSDWMKRIEQLEARIARLEKVLDEYEDVSASEGAADGKPAGRTDDDIRREGNEANRPVSRARVPNSRLKTHSVRPVHHTRNRADAGRKVDKSKRVRVHGFDKPESGEEQEDEDTENDLLPGLVGLYHEGRSFEKHRHTIIDDTINFDFKTGPPVPSMPDEEFSISWIGCIRIYEPGNYTFYTVTDDGVRLYIGGRPVIDNWTDHSATTDIAYLYLGKGDHPVRLDYYENHGWAVCRLLWSSGNFGQEVVPANVVYHRPEEERQPPP